MRIFAAEMGSDPAGLTPGHDPGHCDKVIRCVKRPPRKRMGRRLAARCRDSWRAAMRLVVLAWGSRHELSAFGAGTSQHQENSRKNLFRQIGLKGRIERLCPTGSDPQGLTPSSALAGFRTSGFDKSSDVRNVPNPDLPLAWPQSVQSRTNRPSAARTSRKVASVVSRARAVPRLTTCST